VTEILAIYDMLRGQRGVWLILACGHWLKWAGDRPRVGHEMSCPTCAIQRSSK